MKKNLIIRLIITILVGFITYYITLPAFNLHSFGFYMFVLFIIILFELTGIIDLKNNIKKVFRQGVNKNNIIKKSFLYIAIILVFIGIFLVNFIFSPVFMSNKYKNRITISEDNNFTEDIKEVDFNAIPLLDKDSSSKLGDRVMGQMSELVSQFEVSSLYTQINYNNEIIRVTPLEYANAIKYSGVGLLEEVEGVIIFDPITAKSEYYKTGSIPTWVDQVYSASLIIDQVDDWGMYKKGFFNSIFGQKGVVQTTDGYNYMLQDDDVYLYTGITSINSDESNIGFIISNLRTKETKFYKVPGAEEYSAMDSAKGQVQQMNYTSTFPLLINLNERPTYLISLKDNAGLVKMYAFVDVEDYQKVVVSDASIGVTEAARNYLSNVDINNNNSVNTEKEITIKSITTSIIDGNTYYYIIDNDDQKYKASIKVNENVLPFLNSGNSIKVKYGKLKNVIDIIGIE